MTPSKSMKDLQEIPPSLRAPVIDDAINHAGEELSDVGTVCVLNSAKNYVVRLRKAKRYLPTLTTSAQGLTKSLAMNVGLDTRRVLTAVGIVRFSVL